MQQMALLQSSTSNSALRHDVFRMQGRWRATSAPCCTPCRTVPAAGRPGSKPLCSSSPGSSRRLAAARGGQAAWLLLLLLRARLAVWWRARRAAGVAVGRLARSRQKTAQLQEALLAAEVQGAANQQQQRPAGELQKAETQGLVKQLQLAEPQRRQQQQHKNGSAGVRRVLLQERDGNRHRGSHAGTPSAPVPLLRPPWLPRPRWKRRLQRPCCQHAQQVTTCTWEEHRRKQGSWSGGSGGSTQNPGGQAAAGCCWAAAVVVVVLLLLAEAPGAQVSS